MTVWPSVRNHAVSTWRAVVPRPRLAISWERPVLIMAAFAYVVVLVLIHLHVQGQTVRLQAETLRLEQELQRSRERQALLMKALIPPVAEVSAYQAEVPDWQPLALAPVISEPGSPADRGEPSSSASEEPPPLAYMSAWFEVFHLGRVSEPMLASASDR